MDYYRDPRTGELMAFDRAHIAWAELRCDATTDYRARWVSAETPTLRDAAELQSITQEEAEKFKREADAANAAARGELFLNRMRSTGMGT